MTDEGVVGQRIFGLRRTAFVTLPTTGRPATMRWPQPGLKLAF